MNAIDTTSTNQSVGITSTGIPIRNLWYMLLYYWNEVPISARWSVEVDYAPSLDALLALILANLMQQRLRIGLGRSYTNEERMLRGIRGRVDFTESLNRLAFENGQAYCRFQEFSPNVPKNQIVRSTLSRLVKVGEFGIDKGRAEELRQKLRRLVRDLECIDVIEVSSELIRRQQVGRDDNDYRLMLAICGLILQRQMPTEAAGAKSLPGLDRDSLTLYRVYEKFIANFYRIHLRETWEVTPQAHLDWHATKSSKYLPTMFPDLTLKHRESGRLVVLDTKFTANSLRSGRWDRLVFDSSHLYQVYSYLRSQESESQYHQVATGVLLYPMVGQTLSEEIELQGHSIRVETVDLSQPWAKIEMRLLDIALSTCDP